MNRLKNLFTEYDIDGYIIPKNDEYFNEYTDNSKDNTNALMLNLSIDQEKVIFLI